MMVYNHKPFEYPANPFTDYDVCAYEVLCKVKSILDNFASPPVQRACKAMELSDDNLRTIMERMNASYDEGLAKKDHAAVKQLPSYVRSVPNGTEKGDFLALDLGGTNFRVLLIRLDKNESEMTSKIFRVPESLMR
uniref:Phosphotransferase n=1 Tax=Panagrolaimus sp. ES5 TaxID=591445 RepID=A0AC34GIM2_9BILA